MKSESHRNVTFNLPESLLQEFKVFAAQRNLSMTSLATEAIRQMMQAPLDKDRLAARARMFDRMRNAKDRGNSPESTWSRHDIYKS
ncbi:MAG: hypothetical protein NTW74_25945 [Acidobacteria bacterium]|nr:hypothetical protein [Acidobacteriota bacterium]